MAQRPKKFDIFAPSALPSATVGRRKLVSSKKTDDDVEETYKRWNVRIDEQVAASVKALRDLVAQAEQPDPTAQTLPALHLKLKTSVLIKCAQGLRDTAHELGMALALGSEVDAVRRRDDEVMWLRGEAERLRREIAREGGRLAGGSGEGDGESDGGVGGGEAEGEGVEVEMGVEGEKGDGKSPVKAGSPVKSPVKSSKSSPVKERSPSKPPAAEAMEVDEDEDEFEEV